MSTLEYLEKCEKNYDADCRMLRSIMGPGHYHANIEPGRTVHHILSGLGYGDALLRAGGAERHDRAEEVIAQVLTFQDADPTSGTYGVWPIFREEPLDAMPIPDCNLADFGGSALVRIIQEHGDVLSPDLLQRVRESLGHAAWGIYRRNIGPGYTNIAFAGAVVAAAAGEILDEPRLVDYAQARFRRIIEHREQQGGFNEYNSPGYATASIRWCEWADRFVRDAAVRKSSEIMHRRLWQDYADHFHPGTGQLAGPQSRAYADWIPGSAAVFLQTRIGASIVYRGKDDLEAMARDATEQVPPPPCPPDIAQRFLSLPQPEIELQHRYILRDPEEESVTGTTWLTEDVCLGSVNRDNLWTQRRPLLGYWRTPDDPAAMFRLRFLRDGTDFASAYVCNTQKRNRVLSLVSLLTHKGNWHEHIDHPAVDGLFDAEDFRVRCEVVSCAAQVNDLGDGRFELRADPWRAVIHTAPGVFGNSEVSWTSGRSEEDDGRRVFVDGICYNGPRREFQFAELEKIVIAFGIELLHVEEEPSGEPVRVEEFNGALAASWNAGDGLTLHGPLRAGRHRCSL